MALKCIDFRDITKRVEFIFNEKETVGGHSFIHLKDGVFKAEDRFLISKDELSGYSSHIVFFCEKTADNENRVRYAVNSLWCDLAMGVFEKHVIGEWLLENGEPVKSKTNERGVRSFAEYDNEYCCLISDNYENGKELFEPVNRDMRPLGERAYVNINGHLGYLTEPGIYYFPEDARYRGRFTSAQPAEININSSFEVPCAMIGFSTDFHPTFNCGIRFLAVGEDAIERLMEIIKGTNNSFLHFFKIKKEDENTDDPMPINSDELAGIINRAEEMEKIIEMHKEKYVLPDGWEKVLDVSNGMDPGYNDITVSYKTLFEKEKEAEKYDYVYICGDYLYLENFESNCDPENEAGRGVFINRTKLYIPAVTNLTVSKDIKLNNGIIYPLVVQVFDRRKSVKKQFLKDEYSSVAFEETEMIREK